MPEGRARRPRASFRSGIGLYTTPNKLRGKNSGGPDNLLSGSRSDKRRGNEPRVDRMPGLLVGRLRLRRPDNKLSGPPNLIRHNDL